MNSEIVVLIPHFNNPTGLEDSLASIQYRNKVDVVIVDDGSKDKPAKEAISKRFSDTLSLHFIYNERNLGIENTLNNGLVYIVENLSCKYIARLDCGDICHPNRFIKQKDFLDTNQEVHLIGSWVEFFYEDKALYIYKAPSRHEDIINNMFLKCSFIHPSVMFRTDALKQVGLYPLEYKAAEDYAFFFKFVRRFKTHILPEVLTYCELNPKGISRTKRAVQQKSKINVIMANRSFSPYFFLGLLRNYTMLLLPYSVAAKAKETFLK